MAMLNNQMVSLGLGSLSLSIGLKSPSTAKMTEVLAAQGEFPGHKPVIFRLKWTWPTLLDQFYTYILSLYTSLYLYAYFICMYIIVYWFWYIVTDWGVWMNHSKSILFPRPGRMWRCVSNHMVALSTKFDIANKHWRCKESKHGQPVHEHWTTRTGPSQLCLSVYTVYSPICVTCFKYCFGYGQEA